MPNGLWFAAAVALIYAAWKLDSKRIRVRLDELEDRVDDALDEHPDDVDDVDRIVSVDGVPWQYRPGAGWQAPAGEFPDDALCFPGCPDDECTAAEGCQLPTPPAVDTLPPLDHPGWGRLARALAEIEADANAPGTFIPNRHLRTVE